MPAYDHCKKMKQHLDKFLSKSNKFFHATDSSKKLWQDFVNSANCVPTKCSKKLRKHAAKLAKGMEADLLNLKKSLKTSSSKMAKSAKRSISRISSASNDKRLEKLMKKCDELVALLASVEKQLVECERYKPPESSAEQPEKYKKD